jgi:metal-responsive CopG/Arc/MetJ family transcriptional regulator
MSKPPPTRPARGAINKAQATFVAAWIPNEIVSELDAAVLSQDTDRSKLIRKALRAYLARRAS